MNNILVHNGIIVNEGEIFKASILIHGKKIKQIQMKRPVLFFIGSLSYITLRAHAQFCSFSFSSTRFTVILLRSIEQNFSSQIKFSYINRKFAIDLGYS